MTERMKFEIMNSQFPSGQQSSEYFEALLRLVFPAGSNGEIADIGSRKLGCSARQVRNWLDYKHQPKLRFVWQLWIMAGREASTKLAIDVFGEEMGVVFGKVLPPNLPN
ncbi:MAG: hypothetical protein WEB56_08030 [Roseovarius sp.]